MEDNFQYLSKNLKNYIKNYCRTYCKTLVESYRDIIAERMDYAIEKYYASYDPIYYQRSGKMKHGVYKKYTKITDKAGINPDVYKGGIILDTRYYGGAYPVRGATMNDIYEWSVLQGIHGREVVGNYGMDNKETIYVDQRGNGSFGTGRKKIWTNKSSLYIQNNHKLIRSNEPIIFDSPYNNTLKYNIKAFNKAQQIAINKANSILKPGLFW